MLKPLSQQPEVMITPLWEVKPCSGVICYLIPSGFDGVYLRPLPEGATVHARHAWGSNVALIHGRPLRNFSYSSVSDMEEGMCAYMPHIPVGH